MATHRSTRRGGFRGRKNWRRIEVPEGVDLGGEKIVLQKYNYFEQLLFSKRNVLKNKLLLITEFILIFYFLPISLYTNLFTIPNLAILLLLTFPALYFLISDNRFNNSQLFTIKCSYKILFSLMIRFLISIFLIVAFLFIFLPDLLVISSDNKWRILYTSVFYLFFSVIPQEILYRAFFFHRYETIFNGKHISVGINVFTFSFAHIVCGNWLAIFLTIIGGYFFCKTYQKARSLIITIIEHFLYGMMVFLLGLEKFFI